MKVLFIERVGGHGGMLDVDQVVLGALARQLPWVLWATCDETNVSIPGVRIWKVFRGIFGDTSKPIRGMRYAFGLLRILVYILTLRRTSDVVVHHEFVGSDAPDAPFALLLQIFNVPRIAVIHDVVRYSERRLDRTIDKLVYRTYPRVVVLSEAAKKDLVEIIKVPHSRISALRLPNVNRLFDSCDMTRAEARHTLCLSQEALTVLFFGIIKDGKGLEHLIEAMAKVIARHPNAVLLIAGKPFRSEIGRFQSLIAEVGISDNVRARWDYVPSVEVSAYFRAADLVVLPYTRVFQSANIYTAYGLKRAVVASRVGGLEEQVVDGHTGLLVPPGDTDALAAAILSRDREAFDALGEAGHKWAAQSASPDDLATQLVRLYDDALAGGESHP